MRTKGAIIPKLKTAGSQNTIFKGELLLQYKYLQELARFMLIKCQLKASTLILYAIPCANIIYLFLLYSTINTPLWDKRYKCTPWFITWRKLIPIRYFVLDETLCINTQDFPGPPLHILWNNYLHGYGTQLTTILRDQLFVTCYVPIKLLPQCL